MKKIPENKQASEGAERRQGASLLLADAVCSVLGEGRINAEHTLRDLAINGNDVMKMGFKGKQIGLALQPCLDAVLGERIPNERE